MRLANSRTYPAPWGRMLRVTSVLVTVLCIGACVMTFVFHSEIAGPSWMAAGLLPLLILPGCVPFVVRSYTITDDAILIRRFCWDTRLERSAIRSAVFMPDAMRGSIRTCGNGGAFSITGWYWNRRLGHYRAYVTDLKRTVVLEFPKRKIVVSPDDPEGFVSELGFSNSPHDGVAQEMCA